MLCTISTKTSFRMRVIEECIIEKQNRLLNRFFGEEYYEMLKPLYVFGVTNKYEADIIIGSAVPNAERVIRFLAAKGITAKQGNHFKLRGGEYVGLSTKLRRRSIEESARAAVLVALALNNLIEIM